MKEEKTAAGGAPHQKFPSNAARGHRLGDDASRGQFERRRFYSPRSLAPEQRHEVLNQLFFENEGRWPYVRQFYVLLSISVTIATFGLGTDNAAVVIGGMLIAPLMTPILALAAAAIMGWPVRLFRLAMRLVLATVFVLVLAYLVPFAFALPEQSSIPHEVLARSHPHFTDLIVGLAAGAAGAYLLVRREAAAAIPGVAVAVSLVPPLCSSAFLAYLGRWALAQEAFFLYVTNLAAILASASLVLLAMGFVPHPPNWKFRLRPGLGLVGGFLLVIVVGVPLFLRTSAAINNLVGESIALRAAREWAGASGVEISRVNVDGDLVAIDVRIRLTFETLKTKGLSRFGESLPENMTIERLRNILEKRMNRPVKLKLNGSFVFTEAAIL